MEKVNDQLQGMAEEVIRLRDEGKPHDAAVAGVCLASAVIQGGIVQLDAQAAREIWARFSLGMAVGELLLMGVAEDEVQRVFEVALATAKVAIKAPKG